MPRHKSPLSLKGVGEVLLARHLDMTPNALYERQRALVRAGLLKGKEGWGPGSGVRATPHSVAMLLIGALAADSLSEIEESAKRIAWSKPESGVCAVTGEKTFVGALAAILASVRLAHRTLTITVRRGGSLGPGASIDFVGPDSRTYFHSGGKFRPPGILDVEASLRGFPLVKPAILLLAGGAVEGSDEDHDELARINREEVAEAKRRRQE
jgi:hypothetical protein